MGLIVTGAAGFIGSHFSERMLKQGELVIGLDNLNNYYSLTLKQARLERLERYRNFSFHHADITDRKAIESIVGHYRHQIQTAVLLAAQVGVRHSLADPYSYVNTNILGLVTLLEAFRHSERLQHVIYASSSSVYGNEQDQPLAISQRADQPLSLYAASKRSGELIAASYSHLYSIPISGLRFFSVYGPWGRPDMAPWRFVEALTQEQPIRLFNRGELKRDFTYIDDVIDGMVAARAHPPALHLGEPPHRVYNIGSGRCVDLRYFLELIEQALGRKAVVRLESMQSGDVLDTWADLSDSQRELGFEPKVSLEIGIPRFVSWYRDFHHT